MADRTEDAAARAEVYQLLSVLTAYPTADLTAAVEDGTLNARLAGLLARLGHAPAQPIDAAPTADLGAEYLRLFELSGSRRPCPLYGGIYEADRRAVMEELARLYRHFGLSIEHAEARDLPDSVATVLEFLSFLCDVEARAGSTAVADAVRRAQRDLLARHVTNWTSAILDAVDALNPMPIYRSILDLLDRHCRSELEALGSE